MRPQQTAMAIGLIFQVIAVVFYVLALVSSRRATPDVWYFQQIELEKPKPGEIAIMPRERSQERPAETPSTKEPTP